MLPEIGPAHARLGPGVHDGACGFPEVDRYPAIREPQMHRVIEVHVGDEYGLERRRRILQVGMLQQLDIVEAWYLREHVEMEIILETEAGLPRSQVLCEVLVLEPKGLSEIEEDASPLVLEKDLVATDLIGPAEESNKHHVSQTTIKSGRLHLKCARLQSSFWSCRSRHHERTEPRPRRTRPRSRAWASRACLRYLPASARRAGRARP